MKSWILLLPALVLAGCATANWTPDYNTFSIVKPIVSPSMSYSDDYISISFQVVRGPGYGVEGARRYIPYKGIAFTLRNKTDSVITIDWNRISLVDYRGNSGNAVMHANVKYADCAAPKSPTVIPPTGRLEDIIIPCYGVYFHSGMSYSMWYLSMLPSPRQYPKVQFGVFMPLQIGTETVNYSFAFEGGV
jgi:hypothetical protein